jgi:hypothetical protein
MGGMDAAQCSAAEAWPCMSCLVLLFVLSSVCSLRVVHHPTVSCSCCRTTGTVPCSWIAGCTKSSRRNSVQCAAKTHLTGSHHTLAGQSGSPTTAQLCTHHSSSVLQQQVHIHMRIAPTHDHHMLAS